MAAETWARVARLLRDAGVEFNTATQRWADQVTGPQCCQTRIGLTPGGVPINWHTPDCPGLEQRLAAAVLETPTSTEWCQAATRGIHCDGDAPMLRCSLFAGHTVPHRTRDGATFEERQ